MFLFEYTCHVWYPGWTKNHLKAVNSHLAKLIVMGRYQTVFPRSFRVLND